MVKEDIDLILFPYMRVRRRAQYNLWEELEALGLVNIWDVYSLSLWRGMTVKGNVAVGSALEFGFIKSTLGRSVGSTLLLNK